MPSKNAPRVCEESKVISEPPASELCEGFPQPVAPVHVRPSGAPGAGTEAAGTGEEWSASEGPAGPAQHFPADALIRGVLPAIQSVSMRAGELPTRLLDPFPSV